jgi:hypothetical protein
MQHDLSRRICAVRDKSSVEASDADKISIRAEGSSMLKTFQKPTFDCVHSEINYAVISS